MPKDAYYFPHDGNARRDSKTIALRSVYGNEGYGIYWCLIEVLREQDNYEYKDSKYALNSLSKEVDVPVEKLEPFLNDCINEFELLQKKDGVLYYSETLKERMIPLDSTRERARNAAFARWNKKEEENEKEEIVKKEKVVAIDKIKNIDVLRDNEAFKYLAEDIMSKMPIFRSLGIQTIIQERDKALDWIKSKGTRKSDYRAFFRNWMRNAEKNYVGNSNQTKGKMVR